MCENTITNILMKVSVSGSTSLKESEKKKFTNHAVRKTTVSKLKKANLIYCNFRIYITIVKGHRGIKPTKKSDDDSLLQYSNE